MTMPPYPILPNVDKTVLTTAVRQILKDDSAIIVDYQVHRLSGGFASDTVGGDGTFRISGSARVGAKALRWSLVLKMLSKTPNVGSDDVQDWHYWKREALAYRSDLLTDLEGQLSAPRSFGVTGNDREGYWLWLEDVADELGKTWPLEHYATVARHIGQFNGHALKRPIPTFPWLTRGRAKNWIDLADPYLRDLDGVVSRHPRYDWLSETHVADIQSLWKSRQLLFDAMDRLPRTLCHHDAFRRNLFARTGADGLPETVAIDWQVIGTGALGEDIVPLVCVSLQFMDVPMSKAHSLEKMVFSSYLDGLLDSGCRFDDREVRFAFAATATLMLGLGGLLWLDHFLDPGQHTMVERNIGQPLEIIKANFAELQSYLLALGEEALDTLPPARQT
jgi:hypothetical protein